MSSTISDEVLEDSASQEETFSGYGVMSLRDWFAGMVMQGMLSKETDYYLSVSDGRIAHEAYRTADAMLAHRETIKK